jgi:hypothetical protein
MSPPPNAAGWNNSNVTVTLSATSAPGGAGVKSITYSTTGAQPTPPITVAGGSVQIVISAEGQTTITFAATDAAGITESPAKSITVKIDRTAPELSVQFDPGSKDLLVLGQDGGSGLSSGALAVSGQQAASVPTSVLPAVWTTADTVADATPDTGSRAAELRTYAISDLAGNTTVLVIKVKRPSLNQSQLEARLITIQYGMSTPIAFGLNLEEFEWHLAQSGSLATLDQKFRSGLGQSRQAVDAHYNAQKGHTDVVIKEPRLQPPIQKVGLDLLRMVTDRGHLSIEY